MINISCTHISEINTMDIIGSILFFLESYHFVSHFLVLFRIRLLPARDLRKVGYYFLIDTTTVFVSSFLYTGELRWLATIQIIQHLFFFLTWNKHSYTIKVMEWSSLDWIKSNNNSRWHWDIVLGTLFDLVVHIIYCYLISLHLMPLEISAGVSLTAILTLGLIYNGRYAWSTPGKEPDWVKRRIDNNLKFYGHQLQG